jgi:hypothetical protein
MVENLSAYLRWLPQPDDAAWTETDFLNTLARRTGCALLVDVKNIYVNALNDRIHGTPGDPVQYVDAHDLSEWMVRVAENRTFGTFNATGPKTPTNIAELLYGIKAVTTSDARFTWVPADFLAAQQVRSWSEMPVWMPPTGRTAGFMAVNCARAIAASAIGMLNGSHQMISHVYRTPAGTAKVNRWAPLLPARVPIRSG